MMPTEDPVPQSGTPRLRGDCAGPGVELKPQERVHLRPGTGDRVPPPRFSTPCLILLPAEFAQLKGGAVLQRRGGGKGPPPVTPARLSLPVPFWVCLDPTPSTSCSCVNPLFPLQGGPEILKEPLTDSLGHFSPRKWLVLVSKVMQVATDPPPALPCNPQTLACGTAHPQAHFPDICMAVTLSSVKMPQCKSGIWVFCESCGHGSHPVLCL